MRVKSIHQGSSNANNHVSSTGQDMMILTSNLSNGSVLYAPLMSPKNGEHNGLLPKVMYGNHLLQTIIANDVNDQNHTKVLAKNLDSRDTVVKKGPGGAVQITYKKMVNQTPSYSINPKILPRPPSNSYQSKSGTFENLLQCFPGNNKEDQNVTVKKTCSGNSLSYSSLVKDSTILSLQQLSSVNNINMNPNITTSNTAADAMEANVSMMHLPHGLQSFSILAPPLSQAPTVPQGDISLNGQTLHFASTPNPYSDFQNNVSEVSMETISSSKDFVSAESITKTESSSSFCTLQLNPMPSMDTVNDYSATTDYSTMDNMFDPDTFDRLTNDKESLQLSDSTFADPTDPMLTSQCFTSAVCDMTTDVNIDTSSADTNTVTSFPSEGLIFTDGFITDKSISCESTDDISSNLQTIYDNFDLKMNQPSTKSMLNNVDINCNYENAIPSRETNISISNDLLVPSYTCASRICAQVTSTPVMTTPQRGCLLDIIDVSPEVVSTSGGSKIILIGSWNAKNARYSCQFGNIKVDAELIQNGVLRCYSPIHEAGKVQICIYCDGKCISKKTDFEFLELEESSPSPETTRHEDWLCMTEESHQQLIMERFVAVTEIFGLSNLPTVTSDITSDKLEETLITVCEQLMKANVSVEFEYNIRGSMTILHLAAALGYRKLIQLLYIWLENNANSIMLVEACPRKADQFGLVPVMWAAALGHFDALSVLIQWDESVLLETDHCGCNAVTLAQEQGHNSVAIYLQTSLKKIQSARYAVIVLCS